jgi:formylglycine-generating enzyme required for sulfatase activity
MLLHQSTFHRGRLDSGGAAILVIAALGAHCNAGRSSGPTPSQPDAATADASADENLDGQLPDGAPDDAFFPVNDAACPRDPYLPDLYEPPCEQPKPSPSCAERWCTVQPGCFIMGAPWCEPGRARSANDPVQVTLTHAFRIGQFEVTQREWVAQGLPNHSDLMPDGTGDCIGDDCPASNMTWFEALAFTNRLSVKAGLPECYELLDCAGELGDGMNCNTVRFTNASIYDCRGYRLPTGAEWEYAARAGTKTSFFTGDFPPMSQRSCSGDDVLVPIAWYCANAGPLTHPVGEKRPNGWGLHDIIGNAAEWVGSLGPRADGYGVGPFVDYGSGLDATGFLDMEPRYLVQWRGGTWNGWPSLLSAGRANPTSAKDFKGQGRGLRLAQTISFPKSRR